MTPQTIAVLLVIVTTTVLSAVSLKSASLRGKGRAGDSAAPVRANRSGDASGGRRHSPLHY